MPMSRLSEAGSAGLKPGGKYEMATLELHETASVAPATVRRLTREAVALNAALGNPAQASK